MYIIDSVEAGTGLALVYKCCDITFMNSYSLNGIVITF